MFQRTQNGARLQIHKNSCYQCGKNNYLLAQHLNPNKPNFNVQEAGGKYDAWATPGLEDSHSIARMNDHHQLMSRVHQEIQKRCDPISGNSVVAPMDRDPPILIMKGHAQDVKSVQGIEVPRSDRPRCNLGSEAPSRPVLRRQKRSHSDMHRQRLQRTFVYKQPSLLLAGQPQTTRIGHLRLRRSTI